MTHSQKAVDLVREFEGCRLTSYQDGGGVWTIAYGHTAGVGPNQTCTEEQADAWLDCDLRAADKAVTNHLAVKVTQNQFDALVSFTFNVGAENFEKSILLRLLNLGQSLGAANDFLQWDHIKGKVSGGLLNRRRAEKDLFLEGL